MAFEGVLRGGCPHGCRAITCTLTAVMIVIVANRAKSVWPIPVFHPQVPCIQCHPIRHHPRVRPKGERCFGSLGKTRGAGNDPQLRRKPVDAVFAIRCCPFRDSLYCFGGVLGLFIIIVIQSSNLPGRRLPDQGPFSSPHFFHPATCVPTFCRTHTRVSHSRHAFCAPPPRATAPCPN